MPLVRLFSRLRLVCLPSFQLSSSLKRASSSTYPLTDFVFRCKLNFWSQVNVKDVVDKRSSRKPKDRERDQQSHAKKRKTVTQQIQVLSWQKHLPLLIIS